MINTLGTVGTETHLSGAETDALWTLYATTMEPLRHRAAARHILSRDEFDAELSADSVIKLVGRDEGGNPVALATMSTDASRFDWINADFYTNRFEDTPVFFVGVVLVNPTHQGAGMLSALIDAMTTHVRAGHGIAAFDLCAFNDSRIHLASKAVARAGLVAPAWTEIVDTQTYYCLRFDAPPDGAR